MLSAVFHVVDRSGNKVTDDDTLQYIQKVCDGLLASCSLVFSASVRVSDILDVVAVVGVQDQERAVVSRYATA